MDWLIREPALAPEETLLASAGTNPAPWWLSTAAFSAVVLVYALQNGPFVTLPLALIIVAAVCALTWVVVRTTRYHVTTQRVVRAQFGVERAMPLREIRAVERRDGMFGATLRLHPSRLLARGLKLEYVPEADAIERAIEGARAALAPEVK